MSRLALILALLAVAPGQSLVSGQATPAAPTPVASAFEVATVRPNTTGDRTTGIGISPGGRFRARNAMLRELIAYAHATPVPFIPLANNRVVGGPAWLDNDRFDIEAIASTDASAEPARVLEMLRSLLAERFRLVAHIEERELPVYVLARSRPDGRLGARLQRAASGCSAQSAATTGGAPSGPSPSCGMQRGRGLIDARGMTIDVIVLHALSPVLDRVVVDETGLTGEFDLMLEWNAEQVPQPADVRDGPPASTLGASIFTAVEEQLGLRLEAARRPIEVLVIERVERPAPD